MSGILAMILPHLLPAVGTLVAAGIGYLTLTINTKIKDDNAWKKVAELGAGLLGQAWDTVGPELQAALADGKITAAERDSIEKAVFRTIQKSPTYDVFNALATTLKVPLAAIVAKLASNFVQTWAAAHDPVVTTSSALAFPVAESQFVLEKTQPEPVVG